MPDLHKDPVDHARTTRQHAGESMKNGVNAPGLIAIGIGLVALSAGLFAFATGQAVAGTVGVVLAVLLVGGGLGWLALAHRKVREVESQWHAEHPEAPAEPPTS
ncbi:protein UsfY [Mycolicibacterium hippocampi]|uniref:UsfY protein n=1 Tax=Mycolicibacterium hippocampi TaxID=659824 RepID=A0A850PP12_9MYCO|nr:protein UsfY [Mycolicibacterium hippocampi]NVN52111.1 hypothetical protein [Mycolicibacterium hippocampi]